MEIKVYKLGEVVFINHEKRYSQPAAFGLNKDCGVCDCVNIYVLHRHSLGRCNLPVDAKLILTIKLKGDKK